MNDFVDAQSTALPSGYSKRISHRQEEVSSTWIPRPKHTSKYSQKATGTAKSTDDDHSVDSTIMSLGGIHRMVTASPNLRQHTGEIASNHHQELSAHDPSKEDMEALDAMDAINNDFRSDSSEDEVEDYQQREAVDCMKDGDEHGISAQYSRSRMHGGQPTEISPGLNNRHNFHDRQLNDLRSYQRLSTPQAQTVSQKPIAMHYSHFGHDSGANVPQGVSSVTARPSSPVARQTQDIESNIQAAPGTVRKRKQAATKPTETRNQALETTNPPQSTDYQQDLDYGEAELRRVDFEALMQQSFDIDPNGNPQPDGLAEGNLVERLRKGQSLSQDLQKQFFNNMKINEWDEAGDWFIDQFRDMMDQMRKWRKDKRDLASKFEQHVAQRYEDVESRQNRTDDVLSEMKKTGSIILRSDK